MNDSKYNQEFYHDLAIEFGTTDLITTKNFYHGLVRLIKKRLKTIGYIDLPSLCQATTYQHKGRTYMNVNSRSHDILKPFISVKMKPNNLLRKEIREYYKDL